MSAKMIFNNAKKGLAIIVGNKVDGIIVHEAKLLGEEIQFLDTAYIGSVNQIIYLVGHGSFKERSIDKVHVKDIAEKLVKAGYSGNQILYLVVCDSTKWYHATTIHSLLCCYLRKYGVNTTRVLSNFDGKVVVIENNQNVEIWNLKGNVAKFLMNYNNQQLYMITNNYFVDMRLFSNEYTLTGINAFKKNLIKDYGGENMSSSDIEIGYWRVYFVAYGGLFLLVYY
ncbi:hypothetical protein [uncultured Clostridium sp.]|uniref:hypothetical protein n=1 Tax=uncultured Clostridium sp. TaxID=59620 RepID=UPI00272B634C|nr:hypothetical protein [uncultured Clostridium sp.]